MAENEVHLFDVEKENQSLLDTFEKVQSFVEQEIIEGNNNGECRKDCFVNVKHNLRSKINDSDEESDDSDPGDESEKTSCNIKKEIRDSDFSEEDYTNSSHYEDEVMFETKIEVEYHGVEYGNKDKSGDANEFIKKENIENTSPSRKSEIIKGDKSNGVKNRCPQCLKEFTRKANLKHHLKSQHGDPLQRKKYKCPQCPKAYTEARYLKKHVSRCNIKYNGFEHTCPHCPKVYINKHQFKQHVESQHGDPSHRKKYKCPQCDVMFSSIFSKSRHVQIQHSLCAKYSCLHCPKAFTRSEHLKSHVRIKHGDPLERKKYKCPHCPKAYTYNHNLKKHVQRCHKLIC
ncbi:unnamed protein product [Brassicogethes aeneus]|uniref:C2H2-type domain-containing protein n=1 Tax=Brassicogethes aeneus TaxID=1431903 RepID=A0A9P0FMU7_BRAAE|nr:unnamed protein product [Brassicogethes aeneus]